MISAQSGLANKRTGLAYARRHGTGRAARPKGKSSGSKIEGCGMDLRTCAAWLACASLRGLRKHRGGARRKMGGRDWCCP